MLHNNITNIFKNVARLLLTYVKITYGSSLTGSVGILFPDPAFPLFLTVRLKWKESMVDDKNPLSPPCLYIVEINLFVSAIPLASVGTAYSANSAKFRRIEIRPRMYIEDLLS